MGANIKNQRIKHVFGHGDHVENVERTDFSCGGCSSNFVDIERVSLSLCILGKVASQVLG